MGLIEEIAALMLKEGEAKGQQAKLDIAKQEEERQSKRRGLKMTLKGLATFGPLFLPGMPLAGVLGSKWAGLAASPFEKYLIMSLGGAGANKAANVGTSPGRVPAGLGYTQFSGPLTRNDWYTPSWDEEGIG